MSSISDSKLPCLPVNGFKKVPSLQTSQAVALQSLQVPLKLQNETCCFRTSHERCLNCCAKANAHYELLRIQQVQRKQLGLGISCRRHQSSIPLLSSRHPIQSTHQGKFGRRKCSLVETFVSILLSHQFTKARNPRSDEAPWIQIGALSTFQDKCLV